MTSFIVAGILLTAVAVAIVVMPLLRTGGDTAPVTATIMAVALPASVILLYVTASNFNWIATDAELASATPVTAANNTDARGMDEAVAGLEDRLRREPDDHQGWLLLGRAYLQLQRFSDAAHAYRAALDLDAGSEAKLGLAEAEIIMDRSSLLGNAGQLIEEVLVDEPNNPKALFYGGMAASARDDMNTMRARWERLLDLSPPPEVRRIIEAQLTDLGSGKTAAAEPAAKAHGEISVRISIADELTAQVRPGAKLFLVARDPARPGPPVAVVRESATDLPMIVRISDANAMLPGRSISALDQVQLVARIANSGEPTAQPGDISGEKTVSTSVAQADTVSIKMDRIVR